MTPFYRLSLGVLACWRVTHLLSSESGPWDVLGTLRRRAGASFLGELLSCFYCLSLWTAAPLAYVLASGWKHRLLLWPALSGAAILLERATTRTEIAPPIILEDPEEEDPHVLRN